MIIIVDANILFSALITPSSRLARLLCYPAISDKRISCHLLLTELTNHLEKIIRSAKRPLDEIMQDKQFFLNHITLYDETFIPQQHWLEAERLTSGVDHFDIPYVALALYTGGLLWTGDKKLSAHLKIMGFNRVVNAAELSALLNIE